MVIPLLKLVTRHKLFFRPIEEALEQHHFFVSAFYKGTTIITKHCLELISLKHSEIRILIGNGYKLSIHDYSTRVQVNNIGALSAKNFT